MRVFWVIFFVAIATAILFVVGVEDNRQRQSSGTSSYEYTNMIQSRSNTSLCLDWSGDTTNVMVRVVSCSEFNTRGYDWDYRVNQFQGYGFLQARTCDTFSFNCGDCLHFSNGGGFQKKCCPMSSGIFCDAASVRWAFLDDTYLRSEHDRWYLNHSDLDWYRKDDGDINAAESMCMSYDPDTLLVYMEACDQDSPYQKWEEKQGFRKSPPSTVPS
mmetsp:Transcript_705/g.1701  ORF Transcript_705/g.1701 Transcript_705/m.1701 type:complete len:215 (+) Transcript_705:419-1063(+)